MFFQYVSFHVSFQFMDRIQITSNGFRKTHHGERELVAVCFFYLIKKIIKKFCAVDQK
jgi:hypothetical protein